MTNTKKTFIFIAILILVNCAIYIYPMYQVFSIHNMEEKNRTTSNDINTGYGRMENIINSDIADEYKHDAIWLLTNSVKTRNEQRNEFFKILVYGAVIISIAVAVLGFIIRKKSETNKYIGTAFIFSSILSILLLFLFYFALLNILLQ